MAVDLRNRIFGIPDPKDRFEAVALEVFRFQAEHCAPYRQYLDLLGIPSPAESVQSVDEIPYLPVEFFKSHRIYAAVTPEPLQPQAIFTSSGTTGAMTSQHYVADLSLYEESFTKGFEYFYGPAAEKSLFALLPSYLERTGSSLVYMAEQLQIQNKAHGGFYLHEYDKLTTDLQKAVQKGEQILLLGVAFALLDYADFLTEQNTALSLPPDTIVMETGGMKGRRREISRETMHQTLCQAFGVDHIHSEYGMTELLSQAYSDGEGLFRCPPWMRVTVRDLQNPLKTDRVGQGGVNIIDLANLYSCSFIAVQDRGIVYPDGTFSIQGRIEGAQLRGCNMLIE